MAIFQRILQENPGNSTEKTMLTKSQAPNFEASEPEKMQFHAPTRLTPKKVKNQKVSKIVFDNFCAAPTFRPLLGALSKEAPPGAQRGREFWECFGGFKTQCLEFSGLGVPSLPLRENSESVSFFFLPEFLPESPSRTGGMA